MNIKFQNYNETWNYTEIAIILSFAVHFGVLYLEPYRAGKGPSVHDVHTEHGKLNQFSLPAWDSYLSISCISMWFSKNLKCHDVNCLHHHPWECDPGTQHAVLKQNLPCTSPLKFAPLLLKAISFSLWHFQLGEKDSIHLPNLCVKFYLLLIISPQPPTFQTIQVCPISLKQICSVQTALL